MSGPITRSGCCHLKLHADACRGRCLEPKGDRQREDEVIPAERETHINGPKELVGHALV